jgi:hypothetical protein
MSKKKKRFKSFLKKAGMAAAAIGALGALRNRGAAENRIKGMIENDSFANARRLMTSDPAMRGNVYTDAIMRRQPLGINNMMTPQDMANDPMFRNASAKDGGRIKKTKRGGKAVRKANRSKKK